MMSELILDKSNPDIAAAVGDCKKGDRKKFEVEGEVIFDDPKTLKLQITDLAYSDENETVPEAEAATEEEAPPSPEPTPAPMPRRGPQSPKLKY